MTMGCLNIDIVCCFVGLSESVEKRVTVNLLIDRVNGSHYEDPQAKPYRMVMLLHFPK